MAIIPGHQQALAPKPVSSTSSIDTTLSGYNETGTDHNRQHPITTQQPLHTVMHRPDPSHNSPPSHNAPPTHTPNPVIVSSEAMSQGPATNISHDQVHISPSSGVVVPSAAIPNTNTVPEFLYQLTKMLTDNNRDIIEWSNGKKSVALYTIQGVHS